MLRRLDRTRSWIPSGHICHGCRLRLLAQHGQQIREESTPAASPSSTASDTIGSSVETAYTAPETVEDSWLSNFNSLETPREPKWKSTRKSQDGAAERPKAHAPVRKFVGESTLGPPPWSVNRANAMTSHYNGHETRHTTTAADHQKVAHATHAAFDDVVSTMQKDFASTQADVEDGGDAAKVKVVKQKKRSKVADTPLPRTARGRRISPSYARRKERRWARRAESGAVSRKSTVEVGSEASEAARSVNDLLQELQAGKKAENRTDKSSEEAAPDAKKDVQSEGDLLKASQAGEKKASRQKGSSGIWGSWLFKNVSGAEGEATEVTGSSSSRAVDESSSEPADTTTVPTAFGVDSDNSSSPGEFAPYSVVTVKSPAFDSLNLSTLASSGLAKLHDSGWNLTSSSSPGVFAKKTGASKGRTAKKPETVSIRKKGEAKEETKRLPRRERLKQAKRSTKGKKAKEKEKEKEEAASEDAPQHATVVEAKELHITALDIEQPKVPGLEHGLDRVLFNPGIYQLQDPHSRVYNFDPYLQKVMPVVEFDFNALKEYKTSSEDTMLYNLAQEYKKRYIGSTSSMTGVLRHFHYLLSAFRPLNLDMMSRGFPEKLDTFTQLNRTPDAIFLRHKDGAYAIDADKEHDSPNVLMMLGKSMEKLLTLPKDEFEKYRKSDPRTIPQEERDAPEAFQYTTFGDFLMRSQLDSHDSRLPGTGTFDLKTRAALTIRHSSQDFERMTGYEIQSLRGRFGSYEREYYDMMRATMLKYMLQVRMGRMEGIFVAYHNVARIFGFQYITLQEMDLALHGQTDRVLGDQEFKISLNMLNKVFDLATEKFPGQSIRFHFEAGQEKLSSGETAVMWVFGEPMAEEEIERIQAAPKARTAEFEREMMGIEERDKSESRAGETSTPSSSETAKKDDSSSPPAPSDPNYSGAPPPLFSACIFTQSSVNDRPVDRPTDLKSTDTWNVEYLIQEFPNDTKAWARYEDAKTKRRMIYARARGEEEELAERVGAAVATNRESGMVYGDPKANKAAKATRGYLAFLEGLSAAGRVERERLDGEDGGREVVVVGVPGDAGERGVEEGVVEGVEMESAVEGVEGYMGWLYGKKDGRERS